MFHHAQQELEQRGLIVFNALEHDIPGADVAEDSWIRALSRDIAVISDCDGICVLDSFERSKGALLECFVAISLRRPIILLGHQEVTWRGKVTGIVRAAQERLWSNVDGSKYPHHSDLPVTAHREVSQR